MRRSTLLFLVISILFFATENAYARSALQQMFDSFKDSSNFTSAGGFQDQAAGHYTGGGLALRNRTKTVQPIQLSLPHIGASCSGIDAYFGAISFMKKDELTGMMRRMAQAAPSYGFQLALKTLTPEIETLMAQMRKILMDANNMLLDECKMTQQLFAAAMPKGSEFLKHACTDVAAHSSHGDWFGAREKCAQDKAERDRAVNKIKEKSPDQLIGEYNITWHALMKVPSLKDNKPLAEFIQTVVGTIISRDDTGDYPIIRSFVGKGDSDGFIESTLQGKSHTLYICDEHNKCLNPAPQETVLPNFEKSLFANVQTYIDGIQEKFFTKQPFSPAEHAFIETFQGTPIYGFIQVSAANKSVTLTGPVIQYIAYGFLINQFEWFAEKVLEDINTLEKVQGLTEETKQLRKNIQTLRANLARKKGQMEITMSTYIQNTIKVYETRARSRAW